MSNAPFLSIILPVYNVAPYLKRCISSLLALSMPHEELEIIFVDDCSPDDSVHIIELIIQKYSHFHLIRHKVNKRAGGARNTGLRAAHGKYVFFCDPDDEIVPAGMMNAVRHVRESNETLDVAMFDSCSSKGEELSYRNNSTKVLDAKDFFAVNEVTWSPWLSLYRKNFLMHNDLFFAEHVLFEDIDWVLRAQSYARTIQYQPIIIYKYYANDMSQSNTRPNTLKVSCWIKMAIRIGRLAEEHKNEIGEILRAHSKLALKRGFFSLCFLSFRDREKVLSILKTDGEHLIQGGGIWACPMINNLISLIHPLFMLYDWMRKRNDYK